MVTFKSPEVIVNRTAEDFFTKIGDLNNLKEIMYPKFLQQIVYCVGIWKLHKLHLHKIMIP